MPFSLALYNASYSFTQLGSATSPEAKVSAARLDAAIQQDIMTAPTWVVLPVVQPTSAISVERHSSTVLIEQIEVRALDRLYIFKERLEVLNFIDLHPFLVPLLFEAVGRIAQFFPEPQLSLEVVSDFEFPDSSQLVLSIETTLSPDEALKRLDRFDDDWWLDAAREAEGGLCIDVEFR